MPRLNKRVRRVLVEVRGTYMAGTRLLTFILLSLVTIVVAEGCSDPWEEVVDHLTSITRRVRVLRDII